MRSPSYSAPPLPPAPIDSLASADKELKELLSAREKAIGSATASSRIVAAGRSGMREEKISLEQARKNATREFDVGSPFKPGNSKRIEQLQKYIDSVMSVADKQRRETPRGRSSNIFAGKTNRTRVGGKEGLLTGASRTLLNG